MRTADIIVSHVVKIEFPNISEPNIVCRSVTKKVRKKKGGGLRRKDK